MANQKRSMVRRARWDRLLGALIVLVLLIVFIVSIAKGCSKKDKDAEATGGEAPQAIPTAASEEPTTEPPIDNSKAIFLSPSTQEDHIFACDGETTEEEAMFDLAGRVRALLEVDGYRVYMAETDDSVKTKVERGNSLGCAAYVALHANTSTEAGQSEGTECFYNKNVTGSKALAENIYNRVAELTPAEDRGLKDEEQRTLYEILNNQYPCCLIEIEYHDSEDGSQWILDNQEEVAKAVKDGIVAFMKNQEAGTVPGDEDTEE